MLRTTRAASFCLALPLALAMAAATVERDAIPTQTGDDSMHHARGTFDIRMQPLAEDKAAPVPCPAIP